MHLALFGTRYSASGQFGRARRIFPNRQQASKSDDVRGHPELDRVAENRSCFVGVGYVSKIFNWGRRVEISASTSLCCGASPSRSAVSTSSHNVNMTSGSLRE